MFLYSTQVHRNFQSSGRMSCGSMVLTVAVVLDCGKQHVPKRRKQNTPTVTKWLKQTYNNQKQKNNLSCTLFILEMFLPLILVFLYSVLVIFLHCFSGLSCFVLLVLYGYGFSTCHGNLEAMPDSKSRHSFSGICIAKNRGPVRVYIIFI